MTDGKDTAAKNKAAHIERKRPKSPETIQRGQVLGVLRFGSKSAIRQRKGGARYAPYAEIPQERMGVLS